MNLRRQLFLVSLLTLMLPWAGCQFVRETESALRAGQEQMLAGTAQAISDSLSQFPYEFLSADDGADRLYVHPLNSAPLVDGYADDWTIPDDAFSVMRGVDGPVRYALGMQAQYLFLIVEVTDQQVVYRDDGLRGAVSDNIEFFAYAEDGTPFALQFVPEAPGNIVASRRGGSEETRVSAHWQDTANGYRLEARIPRNLAGPRMGIRVTNTADPLQAAVTIASFAGDVPGPFATVSPVLQSVIVGYEQPGWRLMITDRDGWRLAQTGSIRGGGTVETPEGWTRNIYRLVLDTGAEPELPEPAPDGRELQGHISNALNGETAMRWYRSSDTGRAVLSIAQPVWSGNVLTGALVLQHGTDAILSQTNDALRRLVLLTLLTAAIAAIVLIGYASWLSIRIRNLSAAAEQALEQRKLQSALPSVLASDEIGDLSRSFSSVLRQLGIYNDYLRTLASKLSHELRTPLTIVRSSLENLEHENLGEEARAYTSRAKEGSDRLQKILAAMSEANRTEELIESAEFERCQPSILLEGVVAAYADAWPERKFRFSDDAGQLLVDGSPELLIQMLDKLVDNAVDFSSPNDTIEVNTKRGNSTLIIEVRNPGPPLPKELQKELFDSMVSVRKDDKHLGLGLYVARLIAEGHGGEISAANTDEGVVFSATLPGVVDA